MVDVGEGRLTYSVPSDLDQGAHYVNLVKDLSWMNSKGYEHTTRDGHVYGYLIDIAILDVQDNEYGFGGAPNTWKMRNAFRKFHFKRLEMFDDAGITKDEMGRYGQTIRPYLDVDMVTATVDAGAPTVYSETGVLSPIGADDTQREWTYSKLASNPGWMEFESIDSLATGGTIGLSDEWVLTICGENEVQFETTPGRVQTWTKVGMVHSYNLDRMEVVTPNEEEAISGPNNPLAALSFQGAAIGEVVDIAEEQEVENPPYDIRDSGDSTQQIIYDYTSTNGSTLKINYIRNVFVPAGIFALYSTAEPTDALMTVHVKAIVECRDWV